MLNHLEIIDSHCFVVVNLGSVVYISVGAGWFNVPSLFNSISRVLYLLIDSLALLSPPNEINRTRSSICFICLEWICVFAGRRMVNVSLLLQCSQFRICSKNSF